MLCIWCARLERVNTNFSTMVPVHVKYTRPVTAIKAILKENGKEGTNTDALLMAMKQTLDIRLPPPLSEKRAWHHSAHNHFHSDERHFLDGLLTNFLAACWWLFYGENNRSAKYFHWRNTVTAPFQTLASTFHIFYSCRNVLETPCDTWIRITRWFLLILDLTASVIRFKITR